MREVDLRPAREGDYAAILAFWMPMVRDTAVTFSLQEKDIAGFTDYVDARRQRGREVIVADHAGKIFSFATYDQFRPGDGYACTMEHTVILAPQAHGQGLGRRLLRAVEAHAHRGGAHVMIACVRGENGAALAFHSAMGYREVGRLPDAGQKFDRWLDLVLLQKIL
ncbi:MAG: GNAT family N-acetyltransferase [Pseudooceanicola sp.]|nr:GNAT family N-acetyltransferase [Pseudooceanicola sp.]|tara:strand:+ start:675 stop:1172 length:498 start_codon:yes stop_codon:yes gene_type:complete